MKRLVRPVMRWLAAVLFVVALLAWALLELVEKDRQ